MPPKMDIWFRDAEQLLIDLVKTRAILWDITHRNYRRNDLKEIQWEEISKKMGLLYSSK
ncbi:hypothetical protein ALC57_05390 [Trachymyrmex cornetzi]|uniref:MADF domain-containing protein n=1 Tax=Trachymyrmex cornetzi TaxID=471704 RepID=A0A151JB40_9HYME|nr:hypothetical protein ALC57_05390 [Trachymyrmex cornetzi]